MGSDTIGERLRTVRKRHGLRQEDLAARVGVHTKTVSRWENDAQPPEAGALERAAAELGVTEQWLRYGETRAAEDNHAAARASLVLRGRHMLPPGPYNRLWEYLERLRAAGADEEQLDEAARIMGDTRYAKLNKRSSRGALSDADLVADIDAGWALVWELATRAGLKIPGPRPAFWEG